VGAVVWSSLMVPDLATGWSRVEELNLRSEECSDRQKPRERTLFTLPAAYPTEGSWREVAGWFRLDLGQVCAENGVALAECAVKSLSPGEEVEIPLRRHAAGPPIRNRVGGGVRR